jgi:hypothetical protein
MLAFQLFTADNRNEARAARRLFGFSILYLFILFAGLLADASLHGGSLVCGAASESISRNATASGKVTGATRYD